MEPLKDCNNCKHHVQAQPLKTCVLCFNVPSGHINLPYWESNEVKTLEDAYDALGGPVAFDYAPGQAFVKTGLASDPVKSPAHYMLFPDMESIEAIEKLLNGEEFVGFLKGNILKYRFRAGRKGNSDAKTLEDVRKSEQYAQMLREHLEGSR